MEQTLPPLPPLNECQLGTLAIYIPSNRGKLTLRVKVGIPILIPMQGMITYLFQIEREEDRFHFHQISEPVEHRVRRNANQASPNGKTHYDLIGQDLDNLVQRIGNMVDVHVSGWQLEQIRLVVRTKDWDVSINPETLEAVLVGNSDDSQLLH